MDNLQKATERRPGLRLFWMAAVLAVCALAPAIFPYGGRMVTRGDFMEQQIPFILETRRMLFSGAPFWDWNTFMGANFFGSYAFYTLGSPFVWALMPLPEAAIPYGISLMAVLKHAVAALTAYWYIRPFVKDVRVAQIGGLLYAFSSFSIINTQFYHFMDVVAVFPLLLLALENAFTDKRRFGALALACALNAMVNYYFFFGSALFVAIYAVFRLFSGDWRGRRGLRQLFSVVFECGLGCLLSAWLLFPAGWAMFSISRAGALKRGLAFDWYTWSNTLERIRALLMPIESGVVHGFYGDAASWSSVAGFLPLFGCALALWYICARRREMRWLRWLLIALVFVSINPHLNRLFTLGSNAQYTRWWYCLVLMLCLSTARGLAALSAGNGRDRKWLWGVLAGVCAMSLLLTLPTMLPATWLKQWGYIGNALLANRNQAAYADDTYRALAFGLAGLNFLGLCLSLQQRMLSRRSVLYAALVVSIVANYAGFIALNDTLQPVGVEDSMPLSYYAQHILLEEKPLFTGTTYSNRVDGPHKVRNYGMQINQPSVNSFHSLRSSILDDFVYIAGFGHSESPDAVLKDIKDGALRTALGVKTYYNYDEQHYPGAPEGFVRSGTIGAVTVYDNPHALPIGYAYDTYTNKGHEQLWRNNVGPIMLQAVIFDSGDTDELLDILTPLWERERMTWQEAAARRGAEACYDVEMTPRGLTAKIDLAAERLVFFSTQFDPGWSATVNGNPVKLYNVNMGFVGMRVPAGQGTRIVMTYQVRGLSLGIWTSLAAAVVLAGYWLLCKKWRTYFCKTS